jgi:hypothetical protein
MEHGANILEDMTIPWIIAGPGVQPGTDLSNVEINVMDTAATVLWALGIELPEDMTGRVVLEAFESTTE